MLTIPMFIANLLRVDDPKSFPSTDVGISSQGTRTSQMTKTLSPGEQVVAILDKFWKQEDRPLIIVETGCMRSTHPDAEAGDGWSTLRIAEWLYKTQGGHLWCIDMDQSHIDLAIKAIRDKKALSGEITFICKESLMALDMIHFNIDFAFLDTSDNLEHGLSEFKAVESKGAKVVVMDDIPTKATLAIAYAIDKGWKVTLEGRLAVMRREWATTPEK
jgi:hypothetical protein